MSALSDDGDEDFDYDSDAGFDSDDGANALLEDDVSGSGRAGVFAAFVMRNEIMLGTTGRHSYGQRKAGCARGGL
jgi:hypothetical protein